LPRAILFGGGWSFGLLAVGLLVGLPGAVDKEAIVIGVCSAVLSALAFWIATQMDAKPSWPIAIVGWIGGFFLLPGLVRVLFAIADLTLPRF
jgi:hypothetical protein